MGELGAVKAAGAEGDAERIPAFRLRYFFKARKALNDAQDWTCIRRPTPDPEQKRQRKSGRRTDGSDRDRGVRRGDELHHRGTMVPMCRPLRRDQVNADERDRTDQYASKADASHRFVSCRVLKGGLHHASVTRDWTPIIVEHILIDEPDALSLAFERS